MDPKGVRKTYRDQSLTGALKELNYFEAMLALTPQKEDDDGQGECIRVAGSRITIERNSNVNTMTNISL